MKSLTSKFLMIISMGLLFYIPEFGRCDGIEATKSPAASKMGVSFSVYWGTSTISGGDINDYLQGVNDHWKDLPFINMLGSGPQLLRHGYDFGGEMIARFRPRLCIGLGAGYLLSRKESSAESIWYGVVPYKDTYRPEVRAVPLNLSLYFLLISKNSISLTASAGASCYFGKVKWHHKWERTDIAASFEETWEGNSNALGVQGGLSLEYHFSRMMALVVEGLGRFAVLKSLQGDYLSTVKSTGTENSLISGATLWHYEYDDSQTGKKYPTIMFDKDKPSGKNISQVREGKISLSGFSLRVRIKISLF